MISRARLLAIAAVMHFLCANALNGSVILIDSYSYGSGSNAPGESLPDTVSDPTTDLAAPTATFYVPGGDPLGGSRYQSVWNQSGPNLVSMSLDTNSGVMNLTTTNANRAGQWLMQYGNSPSTHLNLDATAGGNDRFRLQIANTDSNIQLTTITVTASNVVGSASSVNIPLTNLFIDVPFSLFANSGNFFDVDVIYLRFDTVPFAFSQPIDAGLDAFLVIPEPTSLAALGIPLAIVGLLRRRKRGPG